MRTKGQVEEDVDKIGLQQLHIYQPGLITNRKNENEKFDWKGKLASYIPFIPKIESSHLAKGILNHFLGVDLETQLKLTTKLGNQQLKILGKLDLDKFSTKMDSK